MNNDYTGALNVLLAFKHLDFSAITLPKHLTTLNEVYVAASNVIITAIATRDEQLQGVITHVHGSASLSRGRQL